MNKFIILFFILFFSFFPGKTSAQTIPFGGPTILVVPCTCPATPGFYVYIEDFFTKIPLAFHMFLPPLSMYRTPQNSEFFILPSNFKLGSYVPAPATCNFLHYENGYPYCLPVDEILGAIEPTIGIVPPLPFPGIGNGGI